MVAAPRRVAVATSGGRDSIALLHATRRAAAVLGLEVVALHVHHGLLAEADEWQQRLAARCRRWGIALRVARLDGSPGAGDSIEAWARRERYRALTRLARELDIDLVLLAHQRRDQAETVLLQALRGAGAEGLAAMPRLVRREGIVWARPWIDQSRHAIDAYLRRHRLVPAEDPSNADARLARGRLRTRVWPALIGSFADAEVTLAAAASRAAEAAQALAELARLDAADVLRERALSVPAWLALTPARRANLLRAWLRAVVPGPATESLHRRLLDELPRATAARWPAGSSELRLHRGWLRAAPVPAAKGSASVATAAGVDLRRPGRHRLPGWAGDLRVEPATAGGVAPEQLASVTVLARQGGERFRLSVHGSARSLKKQFQACGVPAWEREGPLLYTAAGELLFVPGLGIDAALQAASDVPQLALRWEPDA